MNSKKPTWIDIDEDDDTEMECDEECDPYELNDYEDKWRSRRPTCTGPSIIETEKYPALGEAWERLTEEFEVIRRLTLGK